MDWLRIGRPRNIFFFNFRQGGRFPPPPPPIRSKNLLWYPSNVLSSGNGGAFPGRNRLWREGDRSLPSRTEVERSWRYTCSNSCVLIECCLIKQRDNFTCLPHYVPVACRRVHIFLLYSNKGTRANTHTHTHTHTGVSWRLTGVISFALVTPHRRRCKKQYLISLAFRRLWEINK
jgi:hypothetical protein